MLPHLRKHFYFQRLYFLSIVLTIEYIMKIKKKTIGAMIAPKIHIIFKLYFLNCSLVIFCIFLSLLLIIVTPLAFISISKLPFLHYMMFLFDV